MEEKDAVIVGARCAGSTLAIALAERGWDVLVVDRDTFPSETVSTHFVYPNTVARFGQRVVDLIGAGTENDPVAGVVLENGDRVKAKWVFGADGRGSTVAGRLGLRKERPQRGEIAFLFGYWKGIPDNGYMTLLAREDALGNRWAIEDGLHILIAAGPPDLTRGTREERRRKYLETLGH